MDSSSIGNFLKKISKTQQEKFLNKTKNSRQNSSHPLKKLKSFFSCTSSTYVSKPNTVIVKESILSLKDPVLPVILGLPDFNCTFDIESDDNLGKGILKYNYPQDLFKSKSVISKKEITRLQHIIPDASLEIHENRKKEYLALQAELEARELLSKELKKEISKIEKKRKILSGFYDILEKKKTGSSEKKVEFDIKYQQYFSNIINNRIQKLNEKHSKLHLISSDVSKLENIDAKINVLTMLKRVIEDLDKQDSIIQNADGFEGRHVLEAQNEIFDKNLNFLKERNKLEEELNFNLSELNEIKGRMGDIKNCLNLVEGDNAFLGRRS